MKNGPGKHQPHVCVWPEGRGAKGGREVNLDLALSSPGCCWWFVWVCKEPGALEPDRGHTKVSGPRRSTGPALVPAYRGSTSPQWHQSKLMTVLLLCCAVHPEMNRLAFRLTKSLGMRTAEGWGTLYTAWWAVKEDNASCPLWTAFVNIQIPIICAATVLQVISY